jgi:hypothetical protein
MTQEFDGWADENGLIGVANSVKYIAQGAWQASREHDKAKLMSDEMVEVAAKAILSKHKNVGVFVPNGIRKLTWEDYAGDAKAALSAMVEKIYG